MDVIGPENIYLSLAAGVEAYSSGMRLLRTQGAAAMSYSLPADRSRRRPAHKQGGAKTFVAVPDDDTTRLLVLRAESCLSRVRPDARGDSGVDWLAMTLPCLPPWPLAVDRAMQRQGLGANSCWLPAGVVCAGRAGSGRRGLAHRCQERVCGKLVCQLWRFAPSGYPLSLLLPLTTIETALESAGKR